MGLTTTTLWMAAGLTAFLGLEATAEAASGRVRGYYKFEQFGGGFCETNCSGAKYTASQYGTVQPIKHAKVYVKNQNGSVIGTCSTSETGYYSCPWSSSSLPQYFRVYFHFEDKDLRFKVVQGNETSRYYWRSGAIYPTNGENRYIGTMTLPKMGINQAYDAAQRAYYDRFDDSGRMRADFTGVKIAAYGGDTCKTCASSKTVHLEKSSVAYATTIVIHELGHVADYAARPRKRNYAYCYPYPTLNCGDLYEHAADTEEWRGVAFTEGLANFLTVAAMWSPSAPSPRFCPWALGACTDEDAEAGLTVCEDQVGRHERQTMRYLWDVWDSRNDGETVQSNFYDFIDAIHSIPGGWDWGEKNSPWKEPQYAWSEWEIDAWDSYHQWEYNQGFESRQGIDSSPAYFHNCLHVF